MQNTKSKITQTTIDLFNEHGCRNVSIPQIAEAMGISLGNLTYHFPKKDDLMQSVYLKFQDELAKITKEYRTAADLEEINKQLIGFHQFQERFRFFYLDLLEMGRAYPEIAKHHHIYIEDNLKGIYNYFIFNVGTGNLKPFDNLKVYEQLAHQFWMTAVFWHMQLAFRGKTGAIEEKLAAVWGVVTPYLTEKGKANLELIIGDNEKIRPALLKK